jgi:hypothetical protein
VRLRKTTKRVITATLWAQNQIPDPNTKLDISICGVKQKWAGCISVAPQITLIDSEKKKKLENGNLYLC